MISVEQLLNLSNVKITKIDNSIPGKLNIYVDTTEAQTNYRVCGKTINQKHGKDQERKIRHLPSFGKEVYIIYQPNRYICEDCDNRPTTTATPSWHSSNSSYT